ncbi:hypothetical protein ABEB36_010202 [Hypothenemus hampei]|uniref:Uncharacterized protein n=1 Tax=Hypothenemus hampei TaxID=57062 RepID=A0ABD1EJG1_HYPHA
MNKTFWTIFVIFLLKCVSGCCDEEEKDFNEIQGIDSTLEKFEEVSLSTNSWQGSLTMYPTVATWSLQTNIPVTTNQASHLEEGRGKKFGIKKKMQKYMMPLLIAYKLKFFTLIPVMIGGLILLTGATGLAGFFFALFAAVMGLKSDHGHH